MNCKRHAFRVLLACLVFSTGIMAKNHPVDFIQIPDSLKKRADACILFHNTEIELKKSGGMEQHIHYAVTIFNKNGEGHGALQVGYSKGDKVNIDACNVYNYLGLKDKDIDKDVVQDMSAHGSYSFFSDSRVKYAAPKGRSYPYTVEYDYTVSTPGYIHIDNWMPVYSYDLSLKHATFTLKSFSDNIYESKALNYDFEHNKTNDEEGSVETWEMNAVKAFPYERLSPIPSEIYPTLLVKPNQFNYEGYEGSLATWKSYGLWVNNLLKDRNQLPAETVAEVKNLTDSCTSDLEKARVIYEYMQKRSRYVSIQLGIGGFQPMKASDVNEVGYGDCKALSNYTRALMEAVGIEAYYTEIGSGSRQKIRYPDFSSATQTNHVILTLPLEADTLFLECTSQTYPFGYIGSSNSNREALMMLRDGGKLVHIPAYTPEDNYKNRNLELTLNADGSAHCNWEENRGCWQYEMLIHPLVNLSKEEQRERMLSYLNIQLARMGKLSFTETKALKPYGSVAFEIETQKYASIMGSRYIFHMNPDFEGISLLPDDKNRHSDIVRENGYVDSDTVLITLPQGFQTEYLPKDFSVKNQFGEYGCSLEVIDENHMKYTRRLKMNAGRFSKDLYDELTQFYNLVAEKDNQKVVLKKL